MKKKYSKPMIKKVKLVMDEAVLAGCKIAADPGKNARTCASPACRAVSYS